MFPRSLFISHTITTNERGSIIICDLKLKKRACEIRKISMLWPHFFARTKHHKVVQEPLLALIHSFANLL